MKPIVCARVWFVAGMLINAWFIVVSMLGVPPWWELVQCTAWLAVVGLGVALTRGHTGEPRRGLVLFLLLTPAPVHLLVRYGYTLPSAA